MNVSQPAVRSYMTPSPHAIAAAALLPDAQRLMRVYHLRHLPVLREGVLCGIVTERDLLLAETLIGFDTRRVPVTEAMTEPVFTVLPTDPLAHVASELGKRKLGCAVVVENGEIVGVLTTTDVCFALAEVLNQAATPGARTGSEPTEEA